MTGVEARTFNHRTLDSSLLTLELFSALIPMNDCELSPLNHGSSLFAFSEVFLLDPDLM